MSTSEVIEVGTRVRSTEAAEGVMRLPNGAIEGTYARRDGEFFVVDWDEPLFYRYPRMGYRHYRDEFEVIS